MGNITLDIRSLWLKMRNVWPGWFLAKLAVYALFVVVYFFLVLHWLDAWLKQLFDANKTYYAVVALGLISVQGVFLEMLTSTLMNAIRRRIR